MTKNSINLFQFQETEQEYRVNDRFIQHNKHEQLKLQKIMHSQSTIDISQQSTENI